ncbi:MAG TPA: hypothetical protein VEX11_15040 [Acetobacteraceae bacterium]|nr:hypothetical protein [Acetobacteraceae bacterium]
MSPLHRRTLLTGLAAAALVTQAGAAAAQAAWPARPVRMALPFVAGGPTDTLARLLAEQLSTRLG